MTQSVAYLDHNLVFLNNEAKIHCSKIAVNCSIAVNEVRILQGENRQQQEFVPQWNLVIILLSK